MPVSQQLVPYSLPKLTKSRAHRMSRLNRVTPAGVPIPGVAEHVAIQGQHGLKLRISDIYTALGFVITETDPYSYSGGETPQQLDNIHPKILAHYGKWVNILSGYFDDKKDAMPSTVCIMFKTTHTPLLLAPPNSDSNPGLQTAPPSHMAGSSRMKIQMAVFPNLSKVLKDAGLTLQKKNLDGLIKQLQFSNRLSVDEVQWIQKQFGHCAETLGWLYLLDPEVVGQCFLNGMAVSTVVFKAMGQYNPNTMSSALKGACNNCKYVIKMVNESMTAVRPEQPQNTPPFLYSDRTGDTQSIPGRTGPICANDRCEKKSVSAVQCICMVVWYCSSQCRQHHWARYHRKVCPHYNFCAWPQCNYPTPDNAADACRYVTCGGACSKNQNKSPARYCTAGHRDQDWLHHRTWCQDPAAIGVEPRTQQAMTAKMHMMYGRTV
ncbi:hypothetical protein DFH09DRAFT_1094152 [Mycena vulgaris]|nr:hypothetical protein DFH09DRAFT_1094152 [Mycena vulgaris]